MTITCIYFSRKLVEQANLIYRKKNIRKLQRKDILAFTVLKRKVYTKLFKKENKQFRQLT